MGLDPWQQRDGMETSAAPPRGRRESHSTRMSSALQSRDELLAHGRSVLVRHKQRRESSLLIPPSTPFTPAATRPQEDETAAGLLSRAVAATPSNEDASLALITRHELLELATCLQQLLADDGRSDIVALSQRLVPQATLVLTQLDRARQQRATAEKATSDAQAELARTRRRLELYQKQAALGGGRRGDARGGRLQAEKDAGAREGGRASRARAEREELRQSLTVALEQITGEKQQAEQRAEKAEAALKRAQSQQQQQVAGVGGGGGGGGGGPSTTTAAAAPAAMRPPESPHRGPAPVRWSSFLGDEDVVEMETQ